MKKLYIIRHAKSDWSVPNISDYERGLTKKGKKDIDMIGTYLLLHKINPTLILSSFALRAEETTKLLAQKINFNGQKLYLRELYLSSPESIKEIISVQDEDCDELFIVGHNPEVTELANLMMDEHISKIPTLGVVAIEFNIDDWDDIQGVKGKLDFFIYPNQFKYYLPNQIRTNLVKRPQI